MSFAHLFYNIHMKKENLCSVLLLVWCSSGALSIQQYSTLLSRYTHSLSHTWHTTSDVSIRSRRAGVLDQRIEMSRYSCVRGSWLAQPIRSFDSMYVHTPLQTRLNMYVHTVYMLL